MKEEVWKDVVGYEGIYKVSSSGRVESLPRILVMPNGNAKKHNGKILSTKERHGYPRVILSKNGVSKQKNVHCLIAESFLNHKTIKGLVVDHINNIPNDNRVENLQIITVRKNTTKDRKRSTSLPLGVSKTTSNKYRAAFFRNGKNKHIGVFNCPTIAGFAYLKAIR